MQHENAGIHHFTVGDFVVTALNDGILQGSTDVLTGISGADAETMLRGTKRRLPPHLTVNAFLIRNGDTLALVDTGASGLMGPGLGALPRRLAALGVAPGDIGTVLMTHLHIDHVAGLTDEHGAAAFPNAELVMNEAEAAFWADPAVEAGAPEAMKGAIDLARTKTAPYASRTRRAAAGEVLPGVHLHPLPGHTPGHSGYLVQSGGESLLIWGDIVHVPGLQFARPEIGVAFDADGAAAIETRKRTLDMVATDGLRIAGMHLDFPTFAHVARDGAGYRVVPEVWFPA